MNTKKWPALIALLILGIAFFAGCKHGDGNEKPDSKEPQVNNGPFNISYTKGGKGEGTIPESTTAMYGDTIEFTVTATGNSIIFSVSEDFGTTISNHGNGNYSFTMPRNAVAISVTFGIMPATYGDVFEKLDWEVLGIEPRGWLSPQQTNAPLPGFGKRNPFWGPLNGYGTDNDDGWYGSDDIAADGLGFYAGGAVGGFLNTAGSDAFPDAHEPEYGQLVMFYAEEHYFWDEDKGQQNGSMGRTFRALVNFDDSFTVTQEQITSNAGAAGPSVTVGMKTPSGDFRGYTGAGHEGPPGSGPYINEDDPESKKPPVPAPVVIPSGTDGISFWAWEEGDYDDVKTGTTFIAIFIDNTTGENKGTVSIQFSLDAPNTWQQFFIDFDSDKGDNGFDPTALSGYYFQIMDYPAPMGGTLAVSKFQFFTY